MTTLTAYVRRPQQRLTLAIGAALALVFTASTAMACPIPVFQYSLEYWEADPYDVIVHHEGQLTDRQQKAVDMLRKAEQGEERVANVTVMMRDYRDIENPGPAGENLPRLEVRYPVISGIRRAVWTGELEPDLVEQLLDSPLRQEIAGHLIERDAAVWVLLESGNRSKDRAARQMLERELPRLEQTLEVPDPSDEFGVELGDIYTDIAFTLITLRRDDSQEQMFIEMLLQAEPDLKQYEDEPMAFPIYGRGLVMYALIGQGINETTLNAAGEFLVGPCSCQIKSANPGVDILMAVDWEENVERQSDVEGAGGTAGADGFLGRLDEAEGRFEEDE